MCSAVTLERLFWGGDIRQIHGKSVQLSKRRWIRRSDVGESSAAVTPDANPVVALPAGPVVLPIIDESLVRADRFHDTHFSASYSHPAGCGSTANGSACPMSNNPHGQRFRCSLYDPHAIRVGQDSVEFRGLANRDVVTPGCRNLC